MELTERKKKVLQSIVDSETLKNLGIDIGKIGGGFDVSGDYGSGKDLESLVKYFKNSKSKLYR